MIAFRAIQGVGAGLIMTTSFTSVGDLFAHRRTEGRWIGLFAATFGLASIVGPLAGGALTDHLSWRWIFYINIPVAMVALALVTFGMPWFRQPGQGEHRLVGGGADCRHGDIAAAGPFLGGATSTAGGKRRSSPHWERQRPSWCCSWGRPGGREDPILPLGLFRNRVYTVSILATMVLGAAMFGAMQFLPFFLQGVQEAVGDEHRTDPDANDGAA